MALVCFCFFDPCVVVKGTEVGPSLDEFVVYNAEKEDLLFKVFTYFDSSVSHNLIPMLRKTVTSS